MIKKEAIIFLIVGSLTVLVDLSVYLSLLKLTTMINLSKTISFISGLIFAYFANKFWTFSHVNHNSGTLFRFVPLYLMTLGANVLSNQWAITALANLKYSIIIAFIIATAISASLNFAGMKFFVFTGVKN